MIAAGLWWAYYLIPSRTILLRWPERTWGWRYVHLPLFGAIAAVGAGLHVAAEGVEHQELSLLQITLALAVPVACVVILVFLIWSVLMRSMDFTHVPLFLRNLDAARRRGHHRCRRATLRLRSTSSRAATSPPSSP